MSTLSDFIDQTAIDVFGITRQDAWHKSICINCKSPIRDERGCEKTGEPGQIYSDAGGKEYAISGLCETCFDSIF